ncbi:MAG: DUF4199 domain-containing protein [Bacteroidia bacterium]
MKAYVKYGLLAGLISVALSLIVSFGKLQDSSVNLIFSILTYAAIAAAIFLSVRQKRMEKGDNLTFGQGVIEGMSVAFIAGIVTAVAHYIDAKFINRELTETLYAKMQEELESGTMSDKEMAMAAEYGQYLISPGGRAIMVLIGTLLVGLIISLIVAAILRKEDVENKVDNPMYGDSGDN